jgi:hypothetical protein
MTTAPAEAERSSRKATIARMGAVALGIALVSILVLDQSRALFTATTSNPDNAFSAASIALTDDDGDAAMFTVPPTMVPGDVVTACIEVTYTGTADPAPVNIYRNAYTESDGAGDGATLDDALTFNIDKVDDCTSGANPVDVVDGTLIAAVTGTDYTTGLDGQWNPVASPGGVTVGYNFEVTFTSSVDDNLRIGDGISNLIFTWETQAGT